MRIKIDPTIQNSSTEPKQPSDRFRSNERSGWRTAISAGAALWSRRAPRHSLAPGAVQLPVSAVAGIRERVAPSAFAPGPTTFAGSSCGAATCVGCARDQGQRCPTAYDDGVPQTKHDIANISVLRLHGNTVLG